MPTSLTTVAAALTLILAAALAGLAIHGRRQKKALCVRAAELERWQKRLEGLVSICDSTVWSGSPETTYQRMVETLAQSLGCDEAYIHLLAVTGDHLTECAGHGDLAAVQAELMQLPITTGRVPWMMAAHQPIIMDFLRPHPDDRIPPATAERGYRSAASVPLLASDDVLGMYSIIYKTPQHWTEQDVGYLLAIGRLLGATVQHAQMSQKMVDLQMLMERKRLSAEIHDNLSQLISSLRLGAESALLSCEEYDVAGVRRDLERLSSVAEIAFQTLREEMLSLRTPVDETEGLIPEVRECLTRFERRWGIGTDLQVRRIPEALRLSTQTELQLTRILNEALSNVLRHSAATHVSVVLEGDQDRLFMQIHDNGRGFDPGVVSTERLGIRIMRERASSLAGQLTIQSGEENGTTVRVDVPLSMGW